VTGGLPPETRAHAERDLVATYHRRLGELGVTDYPAETCWDDYRLGVMQLKPIATIGYVYIATPSHRSQEMMRTLLTRSSRAIRELGTFDLIREPSI
jgi:hypothetical protein